MNRSNGPNSSRQLLKLIFVIFIVFFEFYVHRLFLFFHLFFKHANNIVHFFLNLKLYRLDMLSNRITMLFSLLLIFHKAVILFITTNLLIHLFYWFFASHQCLTYLFYCRYHLLNFQIVAVMLLICFTFDTNKRILIAFSFCAKHGYNAPTMLTASNFDSI